MRADLKAGIVRILDSDIKTAGAGFILPGKTLIATCAHVVKLAKAGPGDTVHFVFHANGKRGKARVEPEFWRNSDAEDVAILSLGEPSPKDIEPLPIGTSRGIEGHKFRTFGFPSPKPVEGMGGEGKIGILTEENGYPVLQLTSSEVTLCFSGAPVMDVLTRRVVGMVTSITEQDEHGRLAETAFITPTESLQEVCPVIQFSDICPYYGLGVFTEANAEFFFGRERVADRLVESLRHEPRFLAVLGPSGCGKSSVVQAGLIPRLRQGKVPCGAAVKATILLVKVQL